MILKELILKITREVIEADQRGHLINFPLVFGIKDSKIHSTTSLRDNCSEFKEASLMAGYLAGISKCDALIYIGHGLMQHYTESEYLYALNNFDTEHPSYYPDSFKTKAYIVGVIDFLSGSEHTSYAINCESDIPKNKKFSIGVCKNFYPQLMAIGYTYKSFYEVVFSNKSLLEKMDSPDIVIVERADIIERMPVCANNTI